MESSQVFGFLKILIKSTVIFFKNAKLLAPITALSLLLTSIIVLLFSFSYKCANAYLTGSFTDSTSGVPFLQIGIYSALILAVDLAFMISYIAVVHASGVATVIVSAASLAGADLSVRDLCARAAEKSKIPFRENLRLGPANPMLLLSIAAVGAAVVAVVLNPNPLTIAAVSVLWVSIFAAHAATLATVQATAASYENNALPPCDLFSLFKSKWRGMFVNRPRRSKSPVRLLWYLWMAEITVAAPIAMFIPNPITIAVAGVLVVSFFIFVGGAAAAIAAVEDGCGLEAEGEEAGFSGVALNVSFNAALVAVALTFWWNVRLDLVVYGLFLANCVSVANVLWNVVYTVYYLRCGEYY